MELDECPDDAFLAQRLGDRQHEIGCGRPFRQLSAEVIANDRRNKHGAWLPQHRRLRLDATDTPTYHSQTIHHRRVRVGAEQGIWIRETSTVSWLAAHNAGEVLDVHLMHDAGLGWHDTEIAECRLTPAQEHVTLAIAVVLEVGVQRECA
jgi:hypothetical protein